MSRTKPTPDASNAPDPGLIIGIALTVGATALIAYQHLRGPAIRPMGVWECKPRVLVELGCPFPLSAVYEAMTFWEGVHRADVFSASRPAHKELSGETPSPPLEPVIIFAAGELPGNWLGVYAQATNHWAQDTPAAHKVYQYSHIYGRRRKILTLPYRLQVRAATHELGHALGLSHDRTQMRGGIMHETLDDSGFNTRGCRRVLRKTLRW